MYISTSILSVEENNSTKTFYNLEEAKTDYFHIDVMDGKFVENNTNEKMLNYCNIIKQISNLPLDIHLMVQNVKQYIEEYLKFEPDIITFHYESCSTNEEIMNLIKYLKENNIKVGLSIKPNTKVEEIYKFLPHLYLLLVMTVEPGKGGQALIPETLKKIKDLKKYIEKEDLDTYIQADGGINLETIEDIKNAGTDIIVAGSAIIKSEDYKETIKKLKL